MYRARPLVAKEHASGAKACILTGTMHWQSNCACVACNLYGPQAHVQPGVSAFFGISQGHLYLLLAVLITISTELPHTAQNSS